MNYCPQCGNSVTPDSRFCTNCGKSLTISQPKKIEPTLETSSTSPPSPRHKGTLKLIGVIALGIFLLIVISKPDQDKNGQQEEDVKSTTSVRVPQESKSDRDKEAPQEEVVSIPLPLIPDEKGLTYFPKDGTGLTDKKTLDDPIEKESLEQEKHQQVKAEQEAKEQQEREERERPKIENKKFSGPDNFPEFDFEDSTDRVYDIISVSRMLKIQLSVDVRLKKRVSKETLKNIAMDLWEKDGNNYERMFITYYLAEMGVGGGRWATSHFNPTLEVKILGFSEEEESAFLDEQSDSSLDIIGKWKDSAWPAVITMYHEKGMLFMEYEFGKNTTSKGSTYKKEMISEAIMGQTRFRQKDGNSHGDYYVIDRQGNLGIYDDEGFIRTALSLEGRNIGFSEEEETRKTKKTETKTSHSSESGSVPTIWYSGGNLHRATIKQWNDATYSNKLATAADLTLTVPGIQREILQSNTMEPLRPYASQLVECVDEAGSGRGGERKSVAEMAAACVILMGWQ